MSKEFLKVTKADAVINYSQKVVLARGYFKARNYKKPLQRLKPGMEKPGLVSHVSGNNITGKKAGRVASDDVSSELHQISKRNLTRTRDMLIGYVCANRHLWHSFITLTFADNVTDINVANKKFALFIQHMKRKYPHFRYIGTPEYQKRGAVHYHLLTNLVCGNEIPKRDPINLWSKSDHRYIDLEYYDIPYWKHGFSSAFNIDTTDDHFNVALYITKYLYKDIDQRLFGRNKILKSNDLAKPTVYYLANDAVFNDAITYIRQKGYCFNSFEFTASAPYEVSFDEVSCHGLNDDDLVCIDSILSAVLLSPLSS